VRCLSAQNYQAPATLSLNQWALAGDWTVGRRKPRWARPRERSYRFCARDLHLVLGAGHSGKPVRFRVQLDGADPGASHGADTDASGQGLVKGSAPVPVDSPVERRGDHLFSIEFLDPDVQAYSFTFG
jgi:hypothetical protein